MLAVAAIAAIAANLLNNLPATLVLLPALATLLWRRILHATGETTLTSDFLKLGAISVPAAILAGTTALSVVLITF